MTGLTGGLAAHPLLMRQMLEVGVDAVAIAVDAQYGSRRIEPRWRRDGVVNGPGVLETRIHGHPGQW